MDAVVERVYVETVVVDAMVPIQSLKNLPLFFSDLASKVFDLPMGISER